MGDLAENQAGNQEDKQMKLMDQYNKMTHEIENYDATKRQELSDIKAAQEKTVALLEYISNMERKAKEIGSAGDHEAMKSDLQFKQKEADLSQQTAEKMEQ